MWPLSSRERGRVAAGAARGRAARRQLRDRPLKSRSSGTWRLPVPVAGGSQRSVSAPMAARRASEEALQRLLLARLVSRSRAPWCRKRRATRRARRARRVARAPPSRPSPRVPTSVRHGFLPDVNGRAGNAQRPWSTASDSLRSVVSSQCGVVMVAPAIPLDDRQGPREVRRRLDRVVADDERVDDADALRGARGARAGPPSSSRIRAPDSRPRSPLLHPRKTCPTQSGGIEMPRT